MKIRFPIAAAIIALLVAQPTMASTSCHRHHHSKDIRLITARPHARAQVRVGPVAVSIPAGRIHRKHCGRHHRHMHGHLACNRRHHSHNYSAAHYGCDYVGDGYFRNRNFGIHFHK